MTADEARRLLRERAYDLSELALRMKRAARAEWRDSEDLDIIADLGEQGEIWASEAVATLRAELPPLCPECGGQGAWQGEGPEARNVGCRGCS